MRGVSASGFHDGLDREPSQHAMDDAALLERIRPLHAESAERGRRAGRKRVARLMRRGAIAGVSRRRGFVVTTRRDERQRPRRTSCRKR